MCVLLRVETACTGFRGRQAPSVYLFSAPVMLRVSHNVIFLVTVLKITSYSIKWRVVHFRKS